MKTKILLVLIFLFSTIYSMAQSAAGQTDEIQTLNAQLTTLYKQKNFKEALSVAEKAKELIEKQFGVESYEAALAYSNIGNIAYEIDGNNRAESAMLQALKILKKIINPNEQTNTLLAKSLEKYSQIKVRKQFLEAESALEEAAKFRAKLSGSDAKELSVTYFLLANINYWKKNFKQSKEQYLKVLELIDKHQNVSEDDYQMAYYQCKCSMTKLDEPDAILQLKEKYYNKPNSALSEAIKGLNSGVINGKAVDLVIPPYPQDAKIEQASGSVEIEVFVNKIGRVVAACGKNKAHKSLIQVSEAAALSSKFSPSRLGGEPVSITGVIIYNFAAF